MFRGCLIVRKRKQHSHFSTSYATERSKSKSFAIVISLIACRVVALLTGVGMIVVGVNSAVHTRPITTSMKLDRFVCILGGVGSLVHFYLYVLHRQCTTRCRPPAGDGRVIELRSGDTRQWRTSIISCIVWTERAVYWFCTAFLAGVVAKPLGYPQLSPLTTTFDLGVIICITVNVFFRSIIVNLLTYPESVILLCTMGKARIVQVFCRRQTPEDTERIVDRDMSEETPC